MRLTSFLFICTAVLTVRKSVAKREWIPDDLIKWNKGHGRIIISVPHGGHVKLPNIPNRRRFGCLQEQDKKCSWTHDCETLNSTVCRSVLEADEGTISIAKNVYNVLQSIGLSPHLIVNHLHRVKLDVNRPIKEAAQGNKFAESVYKCFHDSIRQAREMIKGPGLFVDIHGQSHSEKWTEIGYRIPQVDLVYGNFSVFNSTLKALAERTQNLDSKALIVGPESFGSILENRGLGYNVTPSTRLPKPHISTIHNYFEGGYNIIQYGSLNGGLIDAIQVEITVDIRLKSRTIIKQFATDLAMTISTFMKKHNYFDYDEK